MKRLARILFALLGLVLLSVAIMPFAEERAAATQPMPVSVTNTPLPVQGTVSIGNSPSVSVSNTPSVNVANVPSVSLSNSSIAVSNLLDSSSNPLPLLVTTQGQPYTDSCSAIDQTSCSMSALKSNMRLVIQAVGFHSLVNGGDIDEAFLSTTVNGVNSTVFLPVSNTGTDVVGQLYQAAHVPTVLYADPGSTPSCGAFASSNAYNWSCTISGYLVPAP